MDIVREKIDIFSVCSVPSAVLFLLYFSPYSLMNSFSLVDKIDPELVLPT
jgi:hypothetical protein